MGMAALCQTKFHVGISINKFDALLYSAGFIKSDLFFNGKTDWPLKSYTGLTAACSFL